MRDIVRQGVSLWQPGLRRLLSPHPGELEPDVARREHLVRLGGLPLHRTLGRANAPAQKDAGPEEARSTGCDLMLRSVAVRAYLCTTPAKYVGGVLKFIFDRGAQRLGP